MSTIVDTTKSNVKLAINVQMFNMMATTGFNAFIKVHKGCT